jgi:hypothetical protein
MFMYLPTHVALGGKQILSAGHMVLEYQLRGISKNRFVMLVVQGVTLRSVTVTLQSFNSL